MTSRLFLAATVAACALFTSQANAGSPYDSTDPAPAAAARTVPTASGGEYRAIARNETIGSDETPASRRTAAPSSPLGPDGYLPVQPSGTMYNHAAGTMGVP